MEGVVVADYEHFSAVGLRLLTLSYRLEAFNLVRVERNLEELFKGLGLKNGCWLIDRLPFLCSPGGKVLFFFLDRTHNLSLEHLLQGLLPLLFHCIT